MFQITKANVLPCLVGLLYLIGFTSLTEGIQWYEIPNAWIWLGVIPACIGMWVKSSSSK